MNYDNFSSISLKEQFGSNKYYNMLMDIRKILDDDTLCDEDCFDKIEEIVRVFENNGLNGGSRHDFS